MYNSAVLIAVALISGYLYITQTHVQRYIFKRSAGWHCYFHVAAWGVLFASIAWLFTAALHSLSLPSALYTSKAFWATNSPTQNGDKPGEINFFIFCVISLLLPFIWCKIIRPITYKICDTLRYFLCPCKDNSYFSQLKQFKEKRKENATFTSVKDNPFEKILAIACTDRLVVILSLRSRKFYIGRITNMPAFSNGKIEYLQFSPFISGYRDKDTLQTQLTTYYTAIFPDDDALMENKKIIAAENIEDISFFDICTYKRFQQQNTSSALETTAQYRWIL